MIVNCFVYRQDTDPVETGLDEIKRLKNEPGAFVWLGLFEPQRDFMQRVQQEFSLHPLAVDDALSAHQRPKIERYGDTLFIVLKTLKTGDSGALLQGETHLFLGKDFLVTVRHGESEGYSPLRQRVREHPPGVNCAAGYAFYCIMDFIVGAYSETLMQVNADTEELEASMFDGPFNRSDLQNVYRLRRKLLVLRNAAQPVTEICAQISNLHQEFIHNHLRAYIRDVQDHARHIVNDAEDMRELLTSGLHVKLALVSVQQNEIVRKLAGWGAILVVPTIIFSMYGMNFRHMPELDTRYGYPLALAATAGVCGWLWLKLRRSGWL